MDFVKKLIKSYNYMKYYYLSAYHDAVLNIG